MSVEADAELAELAAALEDAAGSLWWRRHGNCQDFDRFPELLDLGYAMKVFFPSRNSSTVRAVQKAREVCFDCPVKAECLEFGLSVKHGFFGGQTERERRVTKRVRRGGQPSGGPGRRCVGCGVAA